MKNLKTLQLVLTACISLSIFGCIDNTDNKSAREVTPSETSLPGEQYLDASFQINDASVRFEPTLDSLVFSLTADANVASIVPQAAGQVSGAPVLGYVFVTSLQPDDIGYPNIEGTVALAVTSHPDFDDTPLWDEDNNQQYDDDGVVYHAHWVVLNENDRASEGLAVIQANATSKLTPTSPMPMYLDSPGFTVLEKNQQLHVLVPLDRVKRNTDFTADVLTAYLEVDTSDGSPLLKVERIYDVYSGNLSLPLTVASAHMAPASAWPALSSEESVGSLAINDAAVNYIEDLHTLVFSMDVMGEAATQMPIAIGQLNGAPVTGYVFPTSLSPEDVGFYGQEGILALAATSHPDFDDTPLWDENGNNHYADDGTVYHVHWVVLVEDENSNAGLSVPSSFNAQDLPPTAPMPMYLDSPGFHAFAQGGKLRIIVPAQRVNNVTQFNFDGVTAKMNVDTSGAGPVLRVNEVINVLSGDLSLPFTVQNSTLHDIQF